MAVRQLDQPLQTLRNVLLGRVTVGRDARRAHILRITTEHFVRTGTRAHIVALLHLENGVLQDEFRDSVDRQYLIESGPDVFEIPLN